MKQKRQFYIMAGATGGLALVIIVVLLVSMTSKPDTKPGKEVADTKTEKQAQADDDADKQEEPESTIRDMFAPKSDGDDKTAKADSDVPEGEENDAPKPPEDAPKANVANISDKELSVEHWKKVAEVAGYRYADKAVTGVKYGDYSYKITDVRYDSHRNPPVLEVDIEVQNAKEFIQQGSLRQGESHLKRITAKTNLTGTPEAKVTLGAFSLEPIRDKYDDPVGFTVTLPFQVRGTISGGMFLDIPDFKSRGKTHNFFIPKSKWDFDDMDFGPESSTPDEAFLTPPDSEDFSEPKQEKPEKPVVPATEADKLKADLAKIKAAEAAGEVTEDENVDEGVLEGRRQLDAINQMNADEGDEGGEETELTF